MESALEYEADRTLYHLPLGNVTLKIGDVD